MSETRMDEVMQRVAAAYPSLFTPDCGCWHDCPPGWEALVMELCGRLVTEHPGVHCVQCKKKFASLRFSLDEGASHGAMALVHQYQLRSSRMCEHCGEPGTLRRWSNGWISTLCDEHATENLPAA